MPAVALKPWHPPRVVVVESGRARSACCFLLKHGPGRGRSCSIMIRGRSNKLLHARAAIVRLKRNGSSLLRKVNLDEPAERARIRRGDLLAPIRFSSKSLENRTRWKPN
jgi:hypothetical protein